MKPPELSPTTTTFVLLSFEGPDAYARAGGLGSRVTELSQALADNGYETHIFFVGDPEFSAHEERFDGRLHLRRVAQSISRYHPSGVYAGEEEKRKTFTDNVPREVLREVARPTIEEGRTLVVMGEDWHTAEAMCTLSDLLYWQGLRRRSILLWNANNVFGFERIDWHRLKLTTQITAVSRYMKHQLQSYAVRPLIIPNGIPTRHLEPVDTSISEALRDHLAGRLLLTKVGRFDPGKNWIPAIRATARLKQMGLSPLLLMRGGVEPHGHNVLREAERHGLRRWDLQMVNPTPERVVAVLDEVAPSVDFVNFRFFVPEEIQRAFFCASDAVLANSSHEPFGLVGLEVMAAGGLAFTGSTGEDYAQHLLNAVTLDTDDPNEIVGNLLFLREHERLARDIRRIGRITAKFYAWDNILEKLQSKLLHLMMEQ